MDETRRLDVPVKLRPIRADEVIPAPETYTAPLQSETHGGLTLALDHIATASDKTILQVSLRFDQPSTRLNAKWSITLSGDDGTTYPLTEVMSDSNNQSKTFETLPFRGGETLTMSLTAFPDAANLPLSVDFPEDQSTFEFDPGVNPQVGQSWNLNERIQVGKYLVHVTNVRQASPTELLFEFAPTPGVTGVMLYSPLANGGTGSLPVENANFTASLSFEKMPFQPIIVSIMRVGYTGMGRKTWVNRITGQQVKVQAFSRLQDGSERIEITDRPLMIEKLDSPPEDVLSIINGVVVP